MTFTMGLLILTACGETEGAPPPDRGAAVRSEIQGCSLLTSAEVAAILGREVQGEEDSLTGFDATCSWRVADGDGFEQEVSIEVGQLDAASIEDAYATFKENMSFREDVSGIGDEAFLAGSAGPGGVLVVRSNTFLIFVNTTVPDREEVLKELGAKVLDRVG